jgi:uncharacterized membrane protein YcaP (DUF421 family)
MEIVLRATALYAFLLVLFRVAGRRTLAQTTVFDLVLLFVIGEMAEPAILGGDGSLTGGAIAIVTLVALDVSLSIVKQRSPRIDRLVDGVPVAIVRDGRPDREAMERERVDEEDVLAAARQTQGLSSMDRISAAVLERNGQISVLAR